MIGIKKVLTVLKSIVALVVLCAAMLALTADIFHIKPSLPSGGSDDSQTGNPPDGSTGDDTPDPDDPKPPVSDPPDEIIPDWSVKPTVIKNSIADKNGKILCEIRYSYPMASSNDGSDISAFTEALDKIAEEVRIYVDSRSELYKLGSGEQFSVPPQITGYYTVNRFSGELLSISFVFSEISPSGSVNETRMHYNLDILLDSSEVTVDAIMNDPVIAVKSILSKKDGGGELALYTNYERLLSGMIDSVWSVSSNGILFYFPSGTIAPVSSGDIEVFIERSELSSLLSEYGKILLNVK